MGTIRDIYRHLRTLNDPWVDRAMAAALPTADPMSVQLIALTLLERQHPEGTLALILRYHLLPADIQQMIVNQVADLYRPLREAAGRNDSQARLNAIEIIRLSRAMRLAYLLTEMLRRRDPHVADKASQALLELAEASSTWSARTTRAAGKASSNPGTDSQATHFLQSALEEAIESFNVHEHSEALKALARLAPRPFSHLLKIFNNARSPAVAEARRLMEPLGLCCYRPGSCKIMKEISVRGLSNVCHYSLSEPHLTRNALSIFNRVISMTDRGTSRVHDTWRGVMGTPISSTTVGAIPAPRQAHFANRRGAIRMPCT